MRNGGGGRPLNSVVRAQMKAPWLAGLTALTGLLLIANGAFAIWSIEPVRALLAEPSSPYATPEDHARAAALLPFLYLVSAEGVGFGGLALVAAAGALVRKAWALPAILFGGIALAVVALLSIALVPTSWDTQLVFVILPALYWWEFRRRRNATASAL